MSRLKEKYQIALNEYCEYLQNYITDLESVWSQDKADELYKEMCRLSDLYEKEKEGVSMQANPVLVRKAHITNKVNEIRDSMELKVSIEQDIAREKRHNEIKKAYYEKNPKAYPFIPQTDEAAPEGISPHRRDSKFGTVRPLTDLEEDV